MALTADDLDALRVLMREELDPLRSEMNSRFGEVLGQIEGLYQRDETREQEYLAIREQVKRADDRLRDFDKRLSALERKAS